MKPFMMKQAVFL